MCQCKECSNKEMELLPEFEGMFGNEYEMEINQEFGIPDFITDAATKIVSPVLDGAQKIVSPFFNWVTGKISTAGKPNFPTAPTGRGGVGLGPFLNFERLEIRYHISKGNLNENNLTDIVFFNRHPELGHKKLSKSIPEYEKLSKEWLEIRNNLVRPLLKSQSEFETIFPEMEFESGGTLKSMVDPKKVSCLTSPHKEAIFKKIGTNDPVAVLNAVSNRAVDMLTNTINELKRIKSRVAAGDPIDYNLISKNLAFGLRFILLMKIKEKSAWLGSGTRNAGLIIRWLTNIRNRIASKDLWFTCLDGSGFCTPSNWAGAIPGKYRIYLCESFWVASPNDNAARHFEYQVQILIHEVSHMYYDTEDKGMGPGSAYCLAKFIANSNNSPVNPNWRSDCGVANPHVLIDPKYGTG